MPSLGSGAPPWQEEAEALWPLRLAQGRAVGGPPGAGGFGGLCQAEEPFTSSSRDHFL